MNYMAEIKMFYDWLETHSLTPASITLWYGLMFIANRSGWNNPLPISLSVIESRTMIPRASIYRERERLREAGLIDFSTKGGKASCLYTIYSLSQQLESHGEMQSVVNEERIQHLESQSEKQNATIIYKLNYTGINKEPTTNREQSSLLELPRCEGGRRSQNSEKEDSKKMEVGVDAPPSLSPEEKKERKSCAKKEPMSHEVRRSSPTEVHSQPQAGVEITKGGNNKKAPHVDIDAILQTLDPPWQEVMQQWLEYKRTRKESYRSEMGGRKCLTMLQNLSGGNPQIAEQIVDKSIANNWAGLFELKQSHYPARGQPATGQHIGQIMQPKDDEHRRKILEKFGKPKK